MVLRQYYYQQQSSVHKSEHDFQEKGFINSLLLLCNTLKKFYFEVQLLSCVFVCSKINALDTFSSNCPKTLQGIITGAPYFILIRLY